MTTWLLLLVLSANPSPLNLTVPEQPIAPTHGAPVQMDTYGSAADAAKEGGITLTVRPVPEGVQKMIGVEVDTQVNRPTVVQISFPTKDGCEAALGAVDRRHMAGQSICLEIR